MAQGRECREFIRPAGSQPSAQEERGSGESGTRARLGAGMEHGALHPAQACTTLLAGLGRVPGRVG